MSLFILNEEVGITEVSNFLESLLDDVSGRAGDNSEIIFHPKALTGQNEHILLIQQ